MTTHNVVNTSLAGQTGDGQFVGDTSPTIFTPVIAQINDATSNAILTLISAPSAANYATITSNPSGGAPSISASGIDTDINFAIGAKGSGVPSSLTTGNIIFQMVSGTAYQHTTLFSASNTAVMRTVTFPDVDFTIATAGANTNITSLTGLTGLIQAPTAIADSSGNGILSFAPGIPSAVNGFIIQNAATGGNPAMAVVGADTNVNMVFFTKGTGGIAFSAAGGTQLLTTFTPVANAVNILDFASAVTGNGPIMSAAGTDTDIQIALVGKGLGRVALYTNSPVGFETRSGTSFQHVTAFTFANTAVTQIVTFPDVTGNVIMDNSVAGQSVSLTLTTATPNNINLAIGTVDNTTITSGVLVSSQGSTSIISASGGSISGLVGSVTASGTLSGTSSMTPVIGILDLTGATVNGGITASLYGTLSGSAPTATNMSNTHGIYFNNATTAVLNSQLLLTGDSQLIFEITSAITSITTPATGVQTGPFKAIKVSINGTTYLMLASTSIA